MCKDASSQQRKREPHAQGETEGAGHQAHALPFLPRFPKGRTGKQGEPSLAFQFWRRPRIFKRRKRANPNGCEGPILPTRGRVSQALLKALASAQDYGEVDQPIRAEAPPPCLVRPEIGRKASRWWETAVRRQALSNVKLMVRLLERALSKNGDRSCFTDLESAPGRLPASGRSVSRETILNEAAAAAASE